MYRQRPLPVEWPSNEKLHPPLPNFEIKKKKWSVASGKEKIVVPCNITLPLDMIQFRKRKKNIYIYLYIYGLYVYIYCYKVGGVHKARSGRSFAARLNLINNPDRSSLVQLCLGSLMWMDVRVLLLQSRTKEYDGSPTKEIYKRFMENKYTACYCKCCSNYIPAVLLRVSLLCFLHGIAFGTQTLWVHVCARLCLVRNVR